MERQQFGTGHVSVEGKILGQEADLLFGANVARLAVQYADSSRVGKLEAHQDADAGSFARAVGAEKSADFARLHFEGNAGQGLDACLAEEAPVDLGDVVKLDGWRHYCAAPAGL